MWNEMWNENEIIIFDINCNENRWLICVRQKKNKKKNLRLTNRHICKRISIRRWQQSNVWPFRHISWSHRIGSSVSLTDGIHFEFDLGLNSIACTVVDRPWVSVVRNRNRNAIPMSNCFRCHRNRLDWFVVPVVIEIFVIFDRQFRHSVGVVSLAVQCCQWCLKV